MGLALEIPPVLRSVQATLSGEPLFNLEGKVISVWCSVVERAAGANLALPIRFAEPLVSLASGAALVQSN